MSKDFREMVAERIGADLLSALVDEVRLSVGEFNTYGLNKGGSVPEF